MSVTIRNIAERSRVSTATVSRVLSRRGDALVTPETQRRVIAVAEELGYRPNRLARALVTGRSQMVALWIDSAFSPYFGHVTHLAQHEALRRGQEMLVRHVTQATFSDAEAGWLSQWPLDGILAFEWPVHLDSFLDVVPAAARPPIVSMGAYYTRRVDFVAVDYYAGALAATRHLLSLGRQRIAFLVNEWGCHPGEPRYDGYAEAMAEAGRAPEYIVTNSASRAEGDAGIRTCIEMSGCPDGLFCFSDDMAIGALRALRDLGRRVPDDIAVIGCDGIEDGEYQVPPLSTVVPPQEEMCALAWDFLQQRIQDPTIPKQEVVLPSHLVIRASAQG